MSNPDSRDMKALDDAVREAMDSINYAIFEYGDMSREELTAYICRLVSDHIDECYAYADAGSQAYLNRYPRGGGC
jgi:adenosylmethionine-8-amino-7-oxononanoate aminotransferase